MKNRMFFLIIVVILCALCLFSCKSKNRDYDEEEVISAAENLIKKSEILNEIYYGHGIGYIMDESKANGYYYEADPTSVKTFNVETIEDIKKLTRECYSVSLANSIMSTKLSSVSDEDDNIIGYARYYQKYEVLDENKPECIMVYKNADVNLTDKLTYDYGTIYVSRVSGEEVFVKITVNVKTDDGKEQTKELEISLIEEESGWRLNSPTYTKYIDRDYYNDLQNK